MIVDPANISELSDKDMLELFEQCGTIEEEMGSTKAEIRNIMRERLDKINRKDLVVEDFIVSRVDSVRFSTTLADAKELGAVVEKAVPDTKKLRELHDKGVKVPGTLESHTVRISKAKQNEK